MMEKPKRKGSMKHCAFGMCNSESRYADRPAMENVFFFIRFREESPKTSTSAVFILSEEMGPQTHILTQFLQYDVSIRSLCCSFKCQNVAVRFTFFIFLQMHKPLNTYLFPFWEKEEMLINSYL